ncbi:MAG: ABC transporter ATP-binding protein [Xanthobacteraceae bacterium]|jgi:branched-chain amino acid transport system ATP-binding protein
MNAHVSPPSQRPGPDTGNVVIRVRDLHAYYGESHILHGVSFDVREREVVSLLGRNGGGRTTTIRAIMGLVDRVKGSIEIKGKQTIGMKPFRIARLGLGYCPEERGIFSSLSCEENLLLPPRVSDQGMSLEQIYDIFPNLKTRRNAPGTKLSGGEQQMLAIARILRTGAKILLLDEISEGLAPTIVDSLAETITKLRSLGYTIVMIEQNFEFAAPLADRFLVMERGRVVLELDQSELAEKTELINHYLGV